MNPMLDDTLRERFEEALRAGDYRPLAMALAAEGHDPAEIYFQFESFMLHLRQAGREEEEDRLMDAMDLLTGWCRTELAWFGREVTNEEIDERRRRG